MPAPRHDTAANNAIVRSFIDAWNNRDFARFDDLMADTCQLAVGADRVSCSPSSTREIAEYWVRPSPTGASSCSISSRKATESSPSCHTAAPKPAKCSTSRPPDDAYRCRRVAGGVVVAVGPVVVGAFVHRE